MSPKNSINFLFPPEKINDLPTWRFILHFKINTPMIFSKRALQKAITKLEQVDLKTARFSCNLKEIKIDPHTKTIPVSIQVPELRRYQQNSLSDYESDVWKIWATIIGFGFTELYYEAVDWHDQPDKHVK